MLIELKNVIKRYGSFALSCSLRLEEGPAGAETGSAEAAREKDYPDRGLNPAPHRSDPVGRIPFAKTPAKVIRTRARKCSPRALFVPIPI